MVEKCYCCEKDFDESLSHCPDCKFKNFKSVYWIPEDIKAKLGTIFRPVSEQLSNEEITKMAEKACDACKFKPTSMQIREVPPQFTLMIYQPDPNDYKKLLIGFHPPNLIKFSHKEVEALLRHEIMHPVTMEESSDHFKIESVSSGMQEIEKGIQTGYDEMINYKEYVKRFPNDNDIQSSKEKQFAEHSCGFYENKYGFKNATKNPVEGYLYILAVYESVVYYFFEQQEKLPKWINDTKCYALFEILKWIHQDLDLIDERTNSREEMRDVILLESKMLLTVSIEDIFCNDKVSFYNYFDSELSECNSKYKSQIGKELVDRWEQRKSHL